MHRGERRQSHPGGVEHRLLIKVSGVGKSYRRPGGGEVMALRDVTATFGSGVVTGVVGRSGSGKSTLIRMLAGLETADRGEITIGDKPVHGISAGQRSALRRDIVSVIFQDHGLIPELTVAENIALAARISAIPADDKSMSKALAQVGLDDFAKRLVGTLSGGEEQRAAIARSLVLRHPVLLADEPTGSLDAENALQVFHALRSASKEGTAVVVATHDDVVYQRCDTLFRMDRGHLQPT